MKKFLLMCFVMLFAFSGVMAENWTINVQPDIPETLNDIFFVNETTGWVVGDDGVIYKTTDGGASWALQTSGTDADIDKVFFVDENTGWAGAVDGSVVLTTDGGSTWTVSSFADVAPHISFSYFRSMYFTSSTEGHIIVGKSKIHYVLKTTDGGQSWAIKDSLATGVTQNWYDISFFDASHGVIVGDKTWAQRYTTDGGETWAESDTITSVNFRDLKAVRWLSETDVVAMGEGNEFWGITTPLFKSTDGGKTWVEKTQTPANVMDRVKDAYFKNATDGICIGNNGFSLQFITKTTDGGETWTATTGAMDFGLSAISGAGDVLYVLGVGNHFMKSADFGDTWEILPVNSPASISAIQFVGAKGYLVNKNSDVLVSSDGTGASWDYLTNAGVWDAYAMDFVDENTGFLLKENRHIVKTTDGGQTWNSVLEPLAFNSRNKVGGIDFADANTGYAWMSINDYDEYYVFKTVDGGENWTEVDSTEGPGYISGRMGCFDAQTCIVVGPDRWMRRTSDGGTTWTTDTAKVGFPDHISLKGDFEDICIVDENQAWAVGSNFVVYTNDKGATWEWVDHGVADIDSSFYTVSFATANLGYIGCYDGVILKTIDGGLTWTKDETYKGTYSFYASAFNSEKKVFFGTSNGVVISGEASTAVEDEFKADIKGYSLSQNYPNPFNPSTTIEFSLARAENVSLKVYDIMGREIKSLVNQRMNAGIHKINLKAMDLASGVYFYQINAGSFQDVRKMVIMK